MNCWYNRSKSFPSSNAQLFVLICVVRIILFRHCPCVDVNKKGPANESMQQQWKSGASYTFQNVVCPSTRTCEHIPVIECQFLCSPYIAPMWTSILLMTWGQWCIGRRRRQERIKNTSPYDSLTRQNWYWNTNEVQWQIHGMRRRQGAKMALEWRRVGKTVLWKCFAHRHYADKHECKLVWNEVGLQSMPLFNYESSVIFSGAGTFRFPSSWNKLLFK